MPDLGTDRPPEPTHLVPPVPLRDLERGVLEHLRDGVAMCRMLYQDGVAVDFEFVHTNPAFQLHSGLKPAPGQRMSEFLPRRRLSGAAPFAGAARVAAGGPPETFETFVGPLRRWFSGQLYGPQPGHFVAIFNEDSVRQLALRRHAQVLAEQRAIIDSGIVGLVKVKDRFIIWANPAFEALFGYSLAELLGQSTQRFYPTREAFEQFAARAMPVMRAGAVYRGETLLQHKDGSPRWCAHNATLLNPDGDEMIGAFIDITARKAAEAALALSEARLQSEQARLRSTFAAMSEGVVLHDGQGRIVDANPAAEGLLGLTREQLLGRDCLDPQWRAVREDGSPFPGGQHPAMVALRSGQPQRGQVMGLQAPAFGQRWISVNADPVSTHPAAPPQGVVATFTDITERRRIDIELAAAAAELRDLYDNAPCGYLSLDAEGRILRLNDTALAWLGGTREQLVGRLGASDFQTAEGRALFERDFPTLLSGQPVNGMEFDLARPVGPVRRVSLSASAILDARGHFVATRSVMHDITELHAAREQLRQLVHEQQAMLDNDLVGIVKVRQRQVVWVNRAVTRILGVAAEDLVGRDSSVFFDDDPEQQAFEEAAGTALGAGQPVRRQLELRHNDGSPIWLDVSGTLLPGAEADSMWLMLDISEHKRAERIRLNAVRLGAENARIRETSRLKGQFIAHMSHELRTPLNGILGSVQLIELGVVKTDSPKFAGILGQIGTCGRQLDQLIGQILDFANVEAGRLEFSPRPAALAGVVQEVVDILQADIERKRIRFACHIDPALDVVEIDTVRLQQVIANFLSNGVKFTPEGGSVALRLSVEGERHFRVEVEDSGIGIAAEQLPRLFVEFDQLSSGLRKEYPGTGLGLALTRRLVEAQGGQVGVRSVPGVGSVFHAILPRLPVSAGPAAQGTPDRTGV